MEYLEYVIWLTLFSVNAVVSLLGGPPLPLLGRELLLYRRQRKLLKTSAAILKEMHYQFVMQIVRHPEIHLPHIDRAKGSFLCYRGCNHAVLNTR